MNTRTSWITVAMAVALVASFASARHLAQDGALEEQAGDVANEVMNTGDVGTAVDKTVALCILNPENLGCGAAGPAADAIAGAAAEGGMTDAVTDALANTGSLDATNPNEVQRAIENEAGSVVSCVARSNSQAFSESARASADATCMGLAEACEGGDAFAIASATAEAVATATAAAIAQASTTCTAQGAAFGCASAAAAASATASAVAEATAEVIAEATNGNEQATSAADAEAIDAVIVEAAAEATSDVCVLSGPGGAAEASADAFAQSVQQATARALVDLFAEAFATADGGNAEYCGPSFAESTCAAFASAGGGDIGGNGVVEPQGLPMCSDIDSSAFARCCLSSTRSQCGRFGNSFAEPGNTFEAFMGASGVFLNGEPYCLC